MLRKIFPLAGFLLLAGSLFSAFAQSGDDDARVTVAINPDGSKTVYQKNGSHNQAIATTTSADGKPQGKIIYKLDSEGRYESGQVFAPNGSLRFVTRYQYNSAGRLVQETQLTKDNSVRSKIVYDYDTAGHPAGYAIYDGDGKLLGRTTAKKPAQEAHPTRSPH
jgi:hypothetical protein